MKNLSKSIVLLFIIAVSVFSCKEESKEIKFSGTFLNSENDSLQIYKGDYIKKIGIDENGNFSALLNIEKPGIYTIFNGKPIDVYLQQGSEIVMKADGDKLYETLAFTGGNETENNFLVNKKNISNKYFSNPQKVFSQVEEPFEQVLNEYETEMKDALAKSNGLSKEFTYLMNKGIEYKVYNYKKFYLERHRMFTRNNEFETTEAFKNEIENKEEIADEHLYNELSEYRRYMRDRFEPKLYFKSQSVDSIAQSVKSQNIEMLNNDISRTMGYFMSNEDNPEEYYNAIKSLATDKKLLDIVDVEYKQLSNIIKGKPSPTFNYENFKGGTTSLEDLKGNLVYIDVWATWCRPCIGEIPYLKKLEKDYHGKDIKFVSISIDERKDYDKWRKMVEEKELTGTQLFADKNWQSSFVVDYLIKGIPRFILLDKEGNVVSSSAKRPSNPGVRKDIDAIL